MALAVAGSCFTASLDARAGLEASIAAGALLLSACGFYFLWHVRASKPLFKRSAYEVIELPVFVGAPLAKWRRMYGFLTPLKILRKIRKRISGRLFLWYRDGLALAFKARNLVTRNAAIE